MLNKLKTLTKILLRERKIKSKSGYVKYIYEENDSEVLIVIFSGFPKENQSGRYNFVRTLENIKANKLFILDDIGPNDRGA